MLENNDRAYSLIEVIISLAIVTLVTSSLVGVCSRQHASSARSFAKSTAQKDAEQILAAIKRDLKVSVAGGLSLGPQGTGIQITRISPNQNNPNVTYTVLFQSVCTAFQPSQTIFNNAYTADVRTALSGPPQACLPKLNCQGGTYPSIQITTSGTQPLRYQPDRLPMLSKSLLEGPAGMALCVEVGPDQLALRIESVMIEGSAGTSRPQVISKVVSLPLPSSSELVLLPN